METTENINKTTPVNPGENKEKKKSTVGLHIFYITLILLLIGSLSYVFKQYKTTTVILNQCDTAKTRVYNEKEAVNQKLDSIESQLMEARTQNDSINEILKQKLVEVRNLRYRVNTLKANSDSLEYYKREIESMRVVAIHYLAMIDSLGMANKQLVDANSTLSTQIEEQKKVDQEKTKQIEDLSSKVEKASILKAFDIVAIPMGKKDKPITKAVKVLKIQVKCTVGENAVIDPGAKTVYMRIIREDGVCLSSSQSNTFQFDNQSVLFTEKADIDYQNKDVKVDMNYVAAGDITSGRYKINLFCDGKELGSTEFQLN
jgi:hypothetical protein